MSIGLLVLMVLVPLLAGALSKKWALSIAFGVGIPLGLLCLLWWCLLLFSVGRQNLPTAYYLVPRMRGRSVAVLAVAAFCIIAAHVGLFALAGAAPLPTAALVTLVLATVATLLLLPAVRWLFVLMIIGLQFFDSPGSLQAWLSQNLPLVTCLTLLLYAVLTVWRFKRFRRAPASGASAHARKTDWYGWYLRKKFVSGDVGALALYSAGPLAHPSLSGLFWLLFALLAGIAFHLASVWWPAWGLAGWSKALVVVPALLGHYFVAKDMVKGILSHQREQALFCLSPAAPGAVACNLVLRKALLREYGLYWVTSSTGLLLFLAFDGLRQTRLLMLAAMLVLSLMWAALLLRDYAHAKPVAVNQRGLPYLLLLGAVGGLFSLLHGVALSTGLACVLLACVLTATVLLARWNRMLRLPPALPAGRLA
ncbi:hypothetical protein [Massilia sp. CF038]|uniref:hypothetical protein n=1 Tax=Massilia sp. CF038 TaxID=1881045 RepID=UPI0011613451|nr:hypothetical protein [Massilia sp. CF038]